MFRSNTTADRNHLLSRSYRLMEIYLIRHTTPDIEKGICYGQTDLELAKTFDTEAQRVLKEVPHNLDVVYSSPLKRCTALANKISSEVRLEDRLKELNFGDWEMKKWDNIPLQEIQPWYDDFVNTPTLNGESYRALQHRVLEFYSDLRQKNHDRVVIVSHSGVIRSLLAHLKSIELINSFKDLKIAYGEVIKLNI